MNVAYNRDCMDVMREYPDGYFDLAVVDPPYGDALHTDGGGNMGWFTKYREDSRDGSQTVHVGRERERAAGGVEPIRGMVRQVQEAGTDSDRDSTDTNTKRLRFHGGSKNPNDPWNRYLRPNASQKNYIVGRSAEAGIFRGTVSRFTESDHLGGQLLSSPPDKMFSDMAQIEYPAGGLFHGTDRIRVDVVRQKRGGV